MTRKSPNIPTNSKDFSKSRDYTLCNHGLKDASHGAMSRRLPIQIGPIPPQPKVTGIPTREDALYKAKRDIEHLLCEVSRLQSRIARLVDTIQWEIKDWNQAMYTGQRKETYESIKRRISGLKGAIAFEGVIGFDKVNDLKER
jgi:hypothetical protein